TAYEISRDWSSDVCSSDLIVAASCVPASLLTLVGSSLQGDDHVLALGIYLGVANLIGWIMSVEIERRERALFWSSRQLSEATRRSEERRVGKEWRARWGV